MSRNEALADMVALSRDMVKRYLKGFDDSNHTRQAPGLPNHAAWSLGHVSLTMHRVRERLDARPLPAEDFSSTPIVRGNQPPRVFFTEDVAFASVPADDALRYPAWGRCVEIFETAVAQLAHSVRGAPDGSLDQMMSWVTGAVPVWQLVVRMVHHNGMHCGQIVDLRRVIGLPLVIV